MQTQKINRNIKVVKPNQGETDEPLLPLAIAAVEGTGNYGTFQISYVDAELYLEILNHDVAKYLTK